MLPAPTRSDERAALASLAGGIESLSQFIERMTPKHTPIPPHLQQVVDVLEATRDREIYALISMPPRHGKTITLAHGLAYRTLYDPSCLNFYATFGADLSVHTSRIVRRLARAAQAPLDEAVQRADDWRTTYGGGLKATSVGGDVTGRGCNGGLIVADDLVKGREQAESKLARDRTWDWFRDDLMSRLEPGASMIVNSTRWHEDDIIGRLLADPIGIDWIHIELPAVIGLNGEAVDEREDPNARALWHDQYPLERLSPIRQRGEHGWWSLYQQRPYPRGGIMFDRSWFKIIDQPGVKGVCVRGWDLAASTNRDSAATCGVKTRFIDGRIIIEDIVWKQGTPHEVEELIVSTAQQDGRVVEQSLPQDPGQAGKSQMTYLASKLHGFKVHFSTETGSKELRAEPLAAQAQAGNVYMVRAPWNDVTLSEFASFPVGKLKDRVDAASRSYARLIERPQNTLARLRALGR